jgi:hypothetical protein
MEIVDDFAKDGFLQVGSQMARIEVSHRPPRVVMGWMATLCIVLFGCAPGFTFRRGPSPQELEVIDAVKLAHSLESSLWSNAEAFTSRHAVFEHYRQAFSEEFAQSLAKYSWSDEHQELNATERVLEVPVRVCVLALDPERATVGYETPPTQVELWDVERFTVDQLRREQGRWAIFQSSDLESVSPAHRGFWRLRSGCN